MVREVCDVLGIKQVARVMDLVTKTHQNEFKFPGTRGRFPNKMVNEAGLYALVMRSNKPNAKAFQKWTPVGWSLARSSPRGLRRAGAPEPIEGGSQYNRKLCWGVPLPPALHKHQSR